MKNPENNIITFPAKERLRELSSETISDEETLKQFDTRLDMEVLDRMFNHLAGLIESSGGPSLKSLELRRDLLSRYTDEQLIELINGSNEADWQSQTTYYMSAINLLVDRHLIPKF